MLTFFRRLGTWLKKALTVVSDVVGDDTVKMALDWVRVAAEKELDNAARREFVVKMLMARGIPESIARLATELAVQLLKKELKELEDEAANVI
jgi:hypothetical protein